MCSVRLTRLFVFLAAIILATVSGSAAEPDSEKDLLKKLENRAKELAKSGLPMKTAEEREKESKPIIPEDCVIEVAVALGDNTFTQPYVVRSGKVTATAPESISPEQSSKGYRLEAVKRTKRFEGDVRGNVISGIWYEETNEHKSWHYETDGRLALHTVSKVTSQHRVNVVLHSDLTATITSEGVEQEVHVRALVGVLNADTGETESTRTSSWEAYPPAQGVWQFRSAAVPTMADEKPSEPTIATDELKPEKFPLPKEKPAKPEAVSQIENPPSEAEIDPEMPPSVKERFDALNAERKAIYTKYHAYGLGWSRTGKLLEWLSDKDLPTKEIEVRASLLLITDQRYWQFYKTVASKVADNYVEGKLWEQAAKATPIAKTVSLVKDLATAPYDLAVIAYEYKDAADAEAVLDEYVRTWGKSEEKVIEELFSTKDAVKFWGRKYGQALEKFKAAQLIAPSASENRPARTPEEKQAVKDMEDAHQAMITAEKELKSLNHQFKALDLRLKTITGDWKEWVVRWGK